MIRTMTEEDQVRALHYKYEMEEEAVRAYLAGGVRFPDLEKAALLSCMTGKSTDCILSLRKDLPWKRVEKELGLTAETYEAAYLTHRADRLHRFYGIKAERARVLLEEGYPNHWIRMAYLLEQHTGMAAEAVLAERSKSVKWRPWAESRLGVRPDDLSAWIRQTRNPSLAPKS